MLKKCWLHPLMLTPVVHKSPGTPEADAAEVLIRFPSLAALHGWAVSNKIYARI
jgi:hypothetical protein